MENKPEVIIEPTMEPFKLFVGPNAHYYITRFRKYQLLGGRFEMSWNWCAFLFGFWWFLYRKMYFWAILGFLSLFLPWSVFLTQAVFGVLANWLYFRHAESTIAMIQAEHPRENIMLYISQLGGVHGWVKVAGLVLFFLQPLFILFVIGMSIFWAGVLFSFTTPIFLLPFGIPL